MMDCEANITIHNVDDDCLDYIVARICDGELWFWGSWDNLEDAKATAKEIDGIVLMRREGDSIAK